jgi:hypothetical protein
MGVSADTDHRGLRHARPLPTHVGHRIQRAPLGEPLRLPQQPLHRTVVMRAGADDHARDLPHLLRRLQPRLPVHLQLVLIVQLRQRAKETCGISEIGCRCLVREPVADRVGEHSWDTSRLREAQQAGRRRDVPAHALVGEMTDDLDHQMPGRDPLAPPVERDPRCGMIATLDRLPDVGRRPEHHRQRRLILQRRRELLPEDRGPITAAVRCAHHATELSEPGALVLTVGEDDHTADRLQVFVHRCEIHPEPRRDPRSKARTDVLRATVETVAVRQRKERRAILSGETGEGRTRGDAVVRGQVRRDVEVREAHVQATASVHLPVVSRRRS